MIPSSDAKMKRAAWLLGAGSRKSVLLALNTTPVGVPPVGPVADGIVTGGLTWAPSPV